MSYKTFRANILNISGTREHKIRNSLGVYDAYKYIRKNKWFNIGRPLTEHEFYQIIRRVNNYLAEELIDGNDVIFPHRLGKLELRKRNSLPIIDKNNRLKVTYAIDWDKTLKLWYDNPMCKERKQLVRQENTETCKVYYNKTKAKYNNKTFYEFDPNRLLKVNLKNNIKLNKIDAFTYGK